MNAVTARIADFLRIAPAGFVVAGAARAERYGLSKTEQAAIDAEFESLALDLYALQAGAVGVYGTFAARRPVVATAAAIPALPVDAFKHAHVASTPPEAARVTFHTSGTTAEHTGVVALEDASLYALSLERGFRHHVMPERERMRILVVAPSVAEAPRSSLSFMFDHVLRHCGDGGSMVLWRDGAASIDALHAALVAASSDQEPVCMLGTAFTWVHVADAFAARGLRLQLPAGSRLLETGGYKGRSRTLERGELLTLVEHTFGIPTTHVVGEYGMTELASQYYTTSLRAAVLGTPLDAVWSHPAWLRPRIMDSITGRLQELDAAHAIGLLAHHDLANVETVAQLLTADLGRPVTGSFVLEGRSRGAVPRGCGLLYEVQGASR